MWVQEKEYFIELLRPYFPSGAEIQRQIERDTLCSFDNLCLSIDWLASDDTSRPNKRSRKIILSFSRELLTDYMACDISHRADEEKRIINLVESYLGKFEPVHNTPREQIQPQEIWFF